MYDLDNAAFGLLACNLSVLERGFLPVDSRHPSDPKDTRLLGMLRRYVVKDHGRLSHHLLGLKGVFHQHEDVHICVHNPTDVLCQALLPQFLQGLRRAPSFAMGVVRSSLSIRPTSMS